MGNNVVTPGPLMSLDEIVTAARLDREKLEKEGKVQCCEACGGEGHNLTCIAYEDIGKGDTDDIVGGSDEDDEEEIPKGYVRTYKNCGTKENGEPIRGPATGIVPMVCLRCYKFGDHLSRNCPTKVKRSQDSESEAVTGNSSTLEGTRYDDTKDMSVLAA